jgi:thiosulfate dehydrogenase
VGKLIVAIIVVAVALFLASFFYVHYGYMNLSATAPYNPVEMFYVRGMLDKWAARNAPKTPNPVQPTDANLIDGVKLYKQNCVVCHGSPQNPVAQVGRALYPHAPQFMKDPPTDMTEGMIYIITKDGVARTGMPAWTDIVSDRDIWTVAAFLKRVDSLPPAVDKEWKSFPVSAPLAPAPPGAGQNQPTETQKQSH